MGRKRFNLFSTPAHLASLLDNRSVCGFQDIFSFSRRPRKLKFSTLSKGIPLISKLGTEPWIFLFIAWKITYLVFRTFRDNLFTANQSKTLANSVFRSRGDSDEIWMVLLRVVSSAYRMKLKNSVHYGMSFIYIRPPWVALVHGGENIDRVLICSLQKCIFLLCDSRQVAHRITSKFCDNEKDTFIYIM